MPKRYSARQILKGKLQTVIVPNHKAIAMGTLSSILRQANISKRDIENNL